MTIMSSLKLSKIAKDESSIQSQNQKNISKLKLQRQNAVHIKYILANSSLSTPLTNHGVIKKFKNYPFRNFGEILIKGLIISSFEHSESVHACYVHINLCSTYLYDAEDELYQLGFVLYTSLKQIRRRTISRTILFKLMCHYFRLKNDKNKMRIIKWYFNKLLESEYLTLIQPNLYQISMHKEIIFTNAKSC